MEIVWKETRELVRLNNGNYIFIVKKFNRKGEQVDWSVLAFDRAGFAKKEEGNEF